MEYPVPKNLKQLRRFLGIVMVSSVHSTIRYRKRTINTAFEKGQALGVERRSVSRFRTDLVIFDYRTYAFVSRF